MKQKRNKGFTMAEMLAVVALILILAAVAAVAVYRYRRAMRQLEYDAVAKEIFIVAQNHLTMADNQGLLGEAGRNPGTKDGAEEDVWYFVYPDTDPDDTDHPSVLGLMLPFGAVDETVRLGGSYVIRYQKGSARILDVFYSAPGDQTGLLGGLGCSFSGLTGDAYTTLKGYGGNDNKEQRKHYAGTDNDDAVIGWYGGEGLGPAKTLLAPTIRIINAERLWVEVTNPNVGKADFDYNLQLIVTEKGNKAHRKAIPLDTSTAVVSYVLDDITTPGKHFADQFSGFTPGADIEIKAVAFSSDVLANIAESPMLTDNSLFASVDADGTVNIANIRHLENLDGAVSGFNSGYESKKAKQITDLSWTDFKTKIGSDPLSVCTISGSKTKGNRYHPIKLDYKLDYDGQMHSISDIEIDTEGKAGVFAENTTTGTSIGNLELIDFNIINGAESGALIGTAKGVTVTNVLARNSRENDNKTNATVTASGAAGGLIGSMTNGGSVTNSAAALIVSGGTDAGGLIGSMSGGNVKNSYAGGHTDGNGQYSKTAYNVTGATTGGLIGTSSASISNCYSTCSASGTTAAGGLIGSADGGEVSNCYATGLVDAPDGSAGALIGTGSVSGGGAGNESYYLWIINQDQTWQKNIVDHSTTPEADVPGGITAADADKDTTTFVSFFNGTGAAQPYDAKLIASYGGKYPMHLVGASGTYAATHYGDWPMPETLVINP